MQINLQVVLLKLKTCQAEEELGKTIIRTFENRKVHSSFIGNIWDTDLAVMKLISKRNSFLYGIDINNKLCLGFSFKR